MLSGLPRKAKLPNEAQKAVRDYSVDQNLRLAVHTTSLQSITTIVTTMFLGSGPGRQVLMLEKV